MEQRQWNPLADVASVLGSVARLLPPLPKPPEQPTPSELPTPLAPQVTSPYVDIRDPAMVSQMRNEQIRQAEQGLVVFKYE